MASRKNKEKKVDEKAIVPEGEAETLKKEEIKADKVITKKEKPAHTPSIAPKAKIGDIVYVSKEADTDLNGFKLFPQYKKYTYTVEDYNPNTDVYTLRKLNLSLSLNGEFIVRPEERAHDSINRMQF